MLCCIHFACVQPYGEDASKRNKELASNGKATGVYKGGGFNGCVKQKNTAVG